MKTFIVTGGLGNQLFIVSGAAAVAAQFGETVTIEVARQNQSGFRETFLDLDLEQFLGVHLDSLVFRSTGPLSRLLFQLFRQTRPTTLLETGYLDKKTLSKLEGTRTLAYLQSLNYRDYLGEHSAPLRVWPKDPSSNFLSALNDLQSAPFSAVHVRRGDYLRHQETIGLLEISFFRRALEKLLGDGNAGSKILVSSDDPSWLERNILELPAAEFVDIGQYGGLSSVETMALLAKSAAMVCSNSSFSLWSAISGRPKSLYIPDPWFKNLQEPLNLLGSNNVTRISSSFT